MTGLLQFLPPRCPQHLLIRVQKVLNNAAHLILTTLHLIFALCTGFQSVLESNTNFVLFVLVLSLLLVLSIFPIYSRFTHTLGNSNLLQTSVLLCISCVNTKSYSERSFSYTGPTLIVCVCVCAFGEQVTRD